MPTNPATAPALTAFATDVNGWAAVADNYAAKKSALASAQVQLADAEATMQALYNDLATKNNALLQTLTMPAGFLPVPPTPAINMPAIVP